METCFLETVYCKTCYILSKDNPADVASRSISHSPLITFKLWKNGPEWLQLPESTFVLEIPNVDSGKRKYRIVTCLTMFSNNDTIDSILVRCSSFCKIKWVIAVLLNPSKYFKRWQNFVTKYIQHQSFAREIHMLQNSQPLHNNSKLLFLCPCIDDHQNLRVGGLIHKCRFIWISVIQLFFEKVT